MLTKSIGLCKTMTPNTCLVEHRDSFRNTTSTGGALHQSPLTYPIESFWHELREYLHAQVNPRNQGELVDEIEAFWHTVDNAKCCKYIGHLRKVIPRVIELEGDASGY